MRESTSMLIIFIAWIMVTTFIITMIWLPLIIELARRAFRIRRLKKIQGKMEANAHLYDEAVKLFNSDRRELGELKLQEYSKKIGVPIAVRMYKLNEDDTISHSTEIIRGDD